MRTLFISLVIASLFCSCSDSKMVLVQSVDTKQITPIETHQAAQVGDTVYLKNTLMTLKPWVIISNNPYSK